MSNNKEDKTEQTQEDRETIYRKSLEAAEAPELEDNSIENNEVQSTQPMYLGKVKTEFDKKAELHEQNKKQFSNIGFRKIDVNNLPSKGEYYDPTIRLKIRAAQFEEIKHYSGLDETDLMDISDHINEILSKCCRVEYSDHIGTSEDLKEADKYYILFAIRDLSMESHQRYNKLWQQCQCPKCGKKSSNEITSHAFGNYAILKAISKHYDPIKRKIVISHESFGEPLTIGPPSIGLTAAIQKYMQEHARKQQQAGAPIYFDANFMLKLQYLLDSSDQVNEIYLEALKKKIDSWPHEKLTAFNYVKDNMDVGVTPQLKIVCRDSKAIDGNEVGCKDDFSFTAPVIFQFGWRSLFDISGIIGELFGADPE